MIIGLTGYAQVGKDTVAKILVEKYGYKRIAFADPLRDVLYDTNPMIDSIAGEPVLLQPFVNKYGWEEAKKSPRVRQYLQRLGLSIREHIDQSVWINKAISEIGSNTAVVITDVRFINEAEVIKLMGGQIWKVVRNGINPINSHISETEMSNYSPDRIIVNENSILELEQQIDAMVGFSV